MYRRLFFFSSFFCKKCGFFFRALFRVTDCWHGLQERALLVTIVAIMRIIADLHIHSRFSRATSKKLTPAYLDRWAGIKGIDLVGSGDRIPPGLRN
jgi:hypothetical protein